ncbi:aminopeptidase N [Psychrobacter aestuarii]|uniref:Aminopeptidase N n=2 Tax=Psychrobacter aestuarii TaxID=556327 RepID=A0ABP3FQG3_9GAMM
MSNNDTQIIDAAVPDAPAHQPEPQKIYLRDYEAPKYTVESVALDIRLFEEDATVEGRLQISRDAAGDVLLHAEDMEIEALYIDDTRVDDTAYTHSEGRLMLHDAPATFALRTEVRICPQTNTMLEGLYKAGTGDETMFVTQCEPEGFRRITPYPDRPDVLSTFTTRLEADKRYPTLLANGNLIEAGEVADAPERHYAIWHDPTHKPSYLFACVVANLDVLSDHYTTSDGRKVLLEVYAKAADIDKCHVGMQALKDAMAWDEDNYGCIYDLDRYMIVAVSQFNMGAMENKGLNIFNTACVLSSPETTTDARSFNVKAVIAHEYFHNWTGNRITCRDWFQLCLKEGFTVFRDQSFSADQQSAAVQRIDDVATLRAYQFNEDAGPLAHPVRPDSFVEINNFYTTTVYEKGAEIVRMLANMLGKEKFRQGTDEYFRRYDGQAVTVEDFLSALSVADERVLSFIDWYRQPGTPVVSGHQNYDAETQTLEITLTQKTRHVAGFDAPKALPIPVATAVFDKESGQIVAEEMLLLDKETQTYRFDNITGAPVVSLLRDFSAPVQLNFDYQDADLAFLLTHETNGFNRWQVTQILVNRILLQNHEPAIYLEALAKTLPNLAKDDAMLAARLLDIPSAQELASAISTDYDPDAVKAKRDGLYQQVAVHLADMWQPLYESLPITEYDDSAEARGVRALRNVVLDMALTAGVDNAADWAVQQYESAACMTERSGALKALVNHQVAGYETQLKNFYERFKADDLVIDLWFSAQAASEQVRVADIEALIAHTDFDWNTPNRVRSVISAFTTQPAVLWTPEGLALYTQAVAKLDDSNPVIASRLVQVLARWYTLVPSKREVAHRYLQALKEKVQSKHVRESLDSVLGAADA